MSLQEAIKLLRLELGMTQSDLAAKLNKAYITVNRWENGKGFPSRSNSRDIISVARRYNASEECISYLYEALMPEAKRGLSAVSYGFPDIERDFLFQLADGSSNAIYVIEADTYKLLYANRKAEELSGRRSRSQGERFSKETPGETAEKQCYYYFSHSNTPCRFCPLAESGSGLKDITVPFYRRGKSYRVHAKASEINGRKIYSIYLTDVTQDDAERNALYKLTNDIPAGVGIYHVYMNSSIELAFMNTALLRIIGEESVAARAK